LHADNTPDHCKFVRISILINNIASEFYIVVLIHQKRDQFDAIPLDHQFWIKLIWIFIQNHNVRCKLRGKIYL